MGEMGVLKSRNLHAPTRSANGPVKIVKARDLPRQERASESDSRRSDATPTNLCEGLDSLTTEVISALNGIGRPIGSLHH